MQDPFEVGHDIVDRYVAIDPVAATLLGIPGHESEWGDQGLDGFASRADLYRWAVASLAPHLEHEDRDRRLAAQVIHGFATDMLDELDAGEHLRDLSHMASSFETFVQVFDLMDRQSMDGWESIRARLLGFEGALEGLIERLEAGRDQGLVVAARQVESVIEQARELAGQGSALLALSAEAPPDRHEQLVDAVAAARKAAAGFGRYLEEQYLPDATITDGVGLERYARAAGRFVGMDLDPHELYSWGWEELVALRSRAKRVAGSLGCASIRAAADLLEADPERAAPSRAAFLEFVDGIQRQALAELSGTHFDVPPEISRVDVKLAPPGGPLGAYYHGPSEDFSRPGGIYYSIPMEGPVPLYQEVSTAYHEGFPGHHLQVGLAMTIRDRLCRAQRSMIWYPGSGEGWALYAERLMDELGFFDRPDFLFGMLASHIFRAARVVVDIGLHLGLPIPPGAPYLEGERWDFDNAVRFMAEIGLQKRSYATSEVLRYLGWPGQAISYKVGEREILSLREDERRRRGASFDLKDFHRKVLETGAIRLDLVRSAVLDW